MPGSKRTAPPLRPGTSHVEKCFQQLIPAEAVLLLYGRVFPPLTSRCVPVQPPARFPATTRRGSRAHGGEFHITPRSPPKRLRAVSCLFQPLLSRLPPPLLLPA